MARELHEVGERTNPVDGNRVHQFDGVFLGIDHQKLDSHQVGVLAGDGKLAPGTRAAGETVGVRRLAQKPLGQIERERMLADAPRPVDEQCMGKVRAATQHRARGIGLPRQER
jgi:hypothetical protein